MFCFVFQFQRKKDLVALTSNEDYDIDEFTKGLADFLFPSYEEFLIAYEEQEQETETKYCILVENNYDFRDDDEKGIEGVDCYNFIEDGNFMHNVFDGFHDMNLDENETFMHCLFDGFPEEINDNERENPVFEEGDSNFHQDDRKSVEKVQEVEEAEVEEEANGCNFIDTSYATTTTSKCQFVLQKDIDSLEKEPRISSLSFLRNVSYDNVFFNTKNIHNLDEDEYVQEHRKFTSSSNFGESNNTNDCSLSSTIPCEDIESKSLKEVEDSKETQFSCDREEVSRGFLDCKNEKESSLYHKEETYDGLSEKIEDDDDDECDWDNNEIMKQIKLKLKYARQGGLSTIFEEEEEQEDDEEEKEYSLKDVEMIKTLSMKYKDQEKMKYEDRNVEIQKVYRCYAQKIRKLDLLNFQVMHAIGE